MDIKQIESLTNRFMQGILSQYYPCLSILADSKKVEKLLDESPKTFTQLAAEVAEKVYGLNILKEHVYPKKYIKDVAQHVLGFLPPVYSSKDSTYIGEEERLCLFWAAVLRFYIRFKISTESVTSAQLSELYSYVNAIRISAMAYHRCSEKKVRSLLARSNMSL